MSEPVLHVPRRVVLRAVIVVAGVIVIVIALLFSGAVARATAATRIADQSDLLIQQAAAERDLERAFEQATTQVGKVRALKLAIPAKQADDIATKALSDLRTLRHSAFISLGQSLGASASNSESYATNLERRFEERPVSADQSPAPVLLAPRLYAIVLRMTQVSGQLSDQATKDLTEPPSSSPTPTASPTSSARP